MGNAASFTFGSTPKKLSSAPKKRRNSHSHPERKGSVHKERVTRSSTPKHPPESTAAWGPVVPRASKGDAAKRKAFRRLWSVDRTPPQGELSDEKRKCVGQWVVALPDPFTDMMQLEPLPDTSLALSVSGSPDTAASDPHSAAGVYPPM
eukprot:Hpha_TRINITY_DN16860_c0_g2::TRINITY_DN16860_c0_g2_i1::g.153310::m.153310